MSREPMYFLGKCVDELLTRNKDYIFKDYPENFKLKPHCIIYLAIRQMYSEKYKTHYILTYYYTDKGKVIIQENPYESEEIDLVVYTPWRVWSEEGGWGFRKK